MLEPVRQRRLRPGYDVPVVKLSAAVRCALERLRSGAPRNDLAGELMRSFSELELFAARLPARDRRHGELAQLVRAVRLRKAD